METLSITDYRACSVDNRTIATASERLVLAFWKGQQRSSFLRAKDPRCLTALLLDIFSFFSLSTPGMQEALKHF